MNFAAGWPQVGERAAPSLYSSQVRRETHVHPHYRHRRHVIDIGKAPQNMVMAMIDAALVLAGIPTTEL
ncbi:hypothetical protein C7T96_20680 [Nitratireductor sp. StC3]|nr:hypothetical protein C7T96_20680 [Nitratireductor sp. StC3]